jgi:hypothetical protein
MDPDPEPSSYGSGSGKSSGSGSTTLMITVENGSDMYWPHIWWLNQAVERGVDYNER